jgi:cyclophilin family peptidyl-prolyl cis-trans isomerase
MRLFMQSLLRLFRRSRIRRSKLELRHGMIAALEARALLAGNVTAQFAQGNLTLTGDGAANDIEITILSGDVIVKGHNGTTINGAATFTVLDGGVKITGSVTARMGAGGDSVLFSNGVAVGGNVVVDLGRDANRFGIDGGTIDGSLTVRGSNAVDRFWTRNATLKQSVNVNLYDGADVVFMEGSNVDGRVRIDAGKGANSFAFQSTTFDAEVALFGRKGSQQAYFEDSTLNGLVFRSNQGADFLMLEDTSNGARTNVAFGKGRDVFVTKGNSDFAGLVRMVGGRDGDRRQFSTESALDGGSKFKSISTAIIPDSEITPHTTNATTGAVPLGAAIRTFFTNLRDPVDLTITMDAPPAGVTQGNGTLITETASYSISGTTKAGATVKLSKDPDGLFDDGTVVAGADGKFTIPVTLTNTTANRGANHFVIQATDSVGRELAQDVDVHLALGSVVRVATSLGNIEVELLDTAAPVTVANFKSYFAEYVNSIIHRSPHPGGAKFVIQGGGFKLDGDDIDDVTTSAAIANEFIAANSNVRGTLSMALPDGQPNGGTSQWFINMADNSSLNAAQHTVFGRVIGNGMNVAEAIHALTSFNVGDFYGESALDETPLQNYTAFSRTLTGTISATAGSTAITGAGTLFTTELHVGSKIQVGTQTFTVQSITSNTSLTVTPVVGTAFTNTAAKTNATPTAANFVKLTAVTTLF